MKKILLISFLSAGTLFSVSATMSSSGTNKDSDRNILGICELEVQKDSLKVVYTCSMHPEIKQDKAGKCSKCGMNLISKEVKKDSYTCPMHSEVVQDKAGKCQKCGMNLVKKEGAVKTEPAKK